MRKYWGPFCVLPKGTNYVHEVYPVAGGLMREEDGSLVAIPDEHLDQQLERSLTHGYTDPLAESFVVPRD